MLEFGFGRLPVMNRLVLKVLAGSVYMTGLTWHNKYFAEDIIYLMARTLTLCLLTKTITMDVSSDVVHCES